MIKKFKLYFYSILFLTKKQIIYQLFYRVKRKIKFDYCHNKYPGFNKLEWIDQFYNQSSYKADFEFIFLNIPHKFRKINWNEDNTENYGHITKLF